VLVFDPLGLPAVRSSKACSRKLRCFLGHHKYSPSLSALPFSFCFYFDLLCPSLAISRETRPCLPLHHSTHNETWISRIMLLEIPNVFCLRGLKMQPHARLTRAFSRSLILLALALEFLSPVVEPLQVVRLVT
jgi:hypothetical protein